MGWEDIKKCARVNPESQAGVDFHRLFCQIVDEGKKEEDAWILALKKMGYKAAHPNDGWVDRKKNIIMFCYPQFYDGVKIGDLVMLGWASDPKENIPVRLTKYRQTLFGSEEWEFEPLKPFKKKLEG